MYLKDQKLFYDTDSPSMLIIPCLTFQHVMDWARDDTTAIAYDALVLTFGENQPDAAETLKLAKAECTAHELEDARALLEQFVKGVAGSVLAKRCP
jgi:NADH dehydrogenase FAD-containing subunit